MSDKNNPPTKKLNLDIIPGGLDKSVRDISISSQMQKFYLDYAMSVIVSRALPDVRDGLKPVQRRIIYAAHSMGLVTGKYKKCAAIIGEVLGKYHPHGDTSAYEALVRMAQDFSLRYPLVDGQGNFGSIDGDPAAAMRYTEAKLTKISAELLEDIDKETIEWRPNYSAEYLEPVILPSKLPNVLLNGASGIAVGMATNIPPHNLGELVDALQEAIDNVDPKAKVKISLPKKRKMFETKEESVIRLETKEDRDINTFETKSTVEDLCNFVNGPDFPTGGIIYNKNEIMQTYATGRGRITMRGVANIEDHKKGRFKIVVTELPFQVNKARLVAKIADLHKNKKVEGISDLRDESDREGMRMVVELKSGARPQKILNQLYKQTDLQQNFNVNTVCLIDNEPKIMTLKMILEEFIKHRQKVVILKSEYELAKLQERQHILEGLEKAIDIIDEVIATIRASSSSEDAKNNLMKKFKFSVWQAEAILEMQLRKLARLEADRITTELKEVTGKINALNKLLSSGVAILDSIKQNLLELKDKYGDKRRTKVIKGGIGEFNEADLIAEEENIFTLTKTGYVKRLKLDTYKTQSRGGKGNKGINTKDEDVVTDVAQINTHSDILFFTNQGRVFKIKAWDIPEASRTSRGTNIVNLLNLKDSEKVRAFYAQKIDKKSKDKFVIFATEKGVVKKSKIDDFKNINQGGIIAIKLKPGDKLVDAQFTTGKDTIKLVTKNGKAIRFSEKDARPMGRGASGVTGLKVAQDDQVVSLLVINEDNIEDNLLTICENGLGKRTPLKEFKIQKRSGKGLIAHNVTPKTGEIVEAKIVKTKEESDLIISTSGGQIIRLGINKINISNRSTQGVILIRMKSGDKVASVALIKEDDSLLKDSEEVKENKLV